MSLFDWERESLRKILKTAFNRHLFLFITTSKIYKNKNNFTQNAFSMPRSQLSHAHQTHAQQIDLLTILINVKRDDMFEERQWESLILEQQDPRWDFKKSRRELKMEQ